MTAPDWQRLKIGQLGRVVTGKTPPSGRPELFGDDHPFITPSDIDGINRIVDTERFISSAGASAFRNQMIPSGSVCFVCIGATIGKLCVATRPSLTNQQINTVVVDAGLHDAKFVYYLLKQLAPNVKGLAGGAATPIISKSSFSDIEVMVAPKGKQRRIASILSAYDDLIENNTQRVAILEETSRRIYEEWFVRFRFPGHEKVRLVESELGVMPEGWRRGTFGDVAKKVSKRFDEERHADRPLFDLGRIPRRSNAISEFGKADEVSTSRIVFDRHTVLFGAIRPNFHKVLLAPFDGVTNVSVHTLTPASGFGVAHLFCLAFADATVAWAVQHSGGMKMPTINWDVLAKMPAPIPDDETRSRFERAVMPMLNAIGLLVRRNVNLRTTRDLVLPKLISGELDVSTVPEPDAAVT